MPEMRVSTDSNEEPGRWLDRRRDGDECEREKEPQQESEDFVREIQDWAPLACDVEATMRLHQG